MHLCDHADRFYGLITDWQQHAGSDIVVGIDKNKDRQYIQIHIELLYCPTLVIQMRILTILGECPQYKCLTIWKVFADSFQSKMKLWTWILNIMFCWQHHKHKYKDPEIFVMRLARRFTGIQPRKEQRRIINWWTSEVPEPVLLERTT